MSRVARTKASLRVVADALDPETVTKILGRFPSWQARRGESNPRVPGARASTGVWSLESGLSIDDPLEAHLAALLEQLPHHAVFRDLPADWDAEVFVGLFMDDINEGFSLSADILRRVSEAGLRLGFDLYGPLNRSSLEKTQ